MPSKIQFWTHVNYDAPDWSKFNGERIDLQFPSVYFDNNSNKYSNIVIPDPYMLVGYATQIKNIMCQDKKAIPWSHKQPKAYFLGALSGSS